MPARFLRPFVLLVIGVTALATACAPSPGPAAKAAPDANGRLHVVADVPPVTSIVENIGGDRVALRGMIPRGVSSHGYEPPPGDVRYLTQADLLIFSGLWLAEDMYRLAEANKRQDSVIVYLGDEVLPEGEWAFDFDFPLEEGRPNPHVWMDPMRALRYAELVHEHLSSLDPDNATYYTENMERFRVKVEDLDQRAREAVQTIPPQHRKLLTYHDCCPYLAERYDFEVIAAIQPSDFSEPSARDVADIIDQVRQLDLPAIFGSEMFPSPVMEQIAQETGAEFVFGIEDDMLPGEPGDREHTYFGMMLDNFEMIVSALGGDTSSLAGFDPSSVFDGESGAIY